MNIIFAAARVWKPIRKMLNSAFNMKILQSFIPIFNAKTDILLGKLMKEINGESFNILPYMNRCTLDMISGKITFDVNLSRIIDSAKIESILDFFSIIIQFCRQATTMGFDLEIQQNKNSDFLRGIEV